MGSARDQSRRLSHVSNATLARPDLTHGHGGAGAGLTDAGVRFSRACPHYLVLEERADHAQAEADLDDAYRELLPMDRALFEALGARTLTHLLGGPERVAMVARLQAKEGELRRARGQHAQATRCFRRALTFLEHAARTTEVDPELLASVRAQLPKKGP